MASYNEVKKLILSTLTDRPAGVEIQPEEHQKFALELLDYARQIELAASSGFMGHADFNTIPIQPDNSNVSYISSVPSGIGVIFYNFIGKDGNPIAVTAPFGETDVVILIWNTKYWDTQIIPFKTGISLIQNPGPNSEVAMSQKAVTDFVTEKTELSIKNFSELDAKKEFTDCGIYNVKFSSGRKVSVGTLMISSDNMGHVINQTLVSNCFVTSEGKIDSSHTDGKVYITFRSYNIDSPQNIHPKGTWSKWEHIGKVENLPGESTTSTISQKLFTDTITSINMKLADKAEQTSVEEITKLVAKKANQTDLDATNEEVAKKANQTDLDATNEEVAKRVRRTDYDIDMAEKEDKTITRKNMPMPFYRIEAVSEPIQETLTDDPNAKIIFDSVSKRFVWKVDNDYYNYGLNGEYYNETLNGPARKDKLFICNNEIFKFDSDALILLNKKHICLTEDEYTSLVKKDSETFYYIYEE